MHGNCVVARITGGVRLVIGDYEIRFGATTLQQLNGEACIPVIQHAGMPGTRRSMLTECEAMHRNEDCVPLLRMTRVQFGANPIVVREEEPPFARSRVFHGHGLITRYPGCLAHPDNGFRNAWTAIAVD